MSVRSAISTHTSDGFFAENVQHPDTPLEMKFGQEGDLELLMSVLGYGFHVVFLLVRDDDGIFEVGGEG